MTKGGRNLMILGLASAVFAIGTTSVSLAFYHNSGDIYLDRSRPGFLPDESETQSGNTDESQEYVFQNSGMLTKSDIKDYLEHLRVEIDELNQFTQPFNPASLSDESLGIPVDEPENDSEDS